MLFCLEPHILQFSIQTMACTIVRDLDHDGMPLSSKNDDEPLVYHNLEVVPPYNLPRLASDVGSSLASSLSLNDDSTIFDEDSVLRPNAVLEHARLNLSAQVTLKEQPPAIDWNLSFHNQITKTMSRYFHYNNLKLPSKQSKLEFKVFIL